MNYFKSVGFSHVDYLVAFLFFRWTRKTDEIHKQKVNLYIFYYLHISLGFFVCVCVCVCYPSTFNPKSVYHNCSTQHFQVFSFFIIIIFWKKISNLTGKETNTHQLAKAVSKTVKIQDHMP